MSDKVIGAGTYIDKTDCEGNKIHVGDTLSFDPTEWGGPCEFVVQIQEGEFLICGSTEDLSEWCTVIKKWDE